MNDCGLYFGALLFLLWHPLPHFPYFRISPQQNIPRVLLFEGDENCLYDLLHLQHAFQLTLSRNPWCVIPAAQIPSSHSG